MNGNERYKSLLPLCPCDTNPGTTDGPKQECPIHGDGVTFVSEVQWLWRVHEKAGTLIAAFAAQNHPAIDDALVALHGELSNAK